MTKILVDKAVIEQALEVLSNTGTQRGREPQQFHAEGKSIEALHSALKQPQVEQETKSYKVTGKTGEFCVFHSTEVKRGDMVYTHPKPSQPLTEEEIYNALRPIYSSEFSCRAAVGLALDEYRAIEAAHGIK